ncbi:ATP-binding protein [Cytobacillus purgationiresistens]|uniref:histidine kinase n=1 Tax=Cytobacillus purgationiresistens TaxID=863449 RepID=A0ABU0ARM7_9BACI|nr:ATP-binding protein [Cytobacillus purgationiresistens]MDQ0273943.1 two-component system sensor histidine kinase BaeS [Cytobacillus purgationiresistens]
MWINKKFQNLLSKLVALNSIVILFVIILAGISVKDYACFLVNSEQVIGKELVDTLNSFLWKIGILSFLLVGVFHYITVKKIIAPIKELTEAAKEIKAGHLPKKVNVQTTGEINELINNFNAMTEKLKYVQERRDDMLRDIAHELRTPLTNINGYLEALQNKVITGTPELFGSLLEESRRITRVVELITELNSWHPDYLFLEKEFKPLKVNIILEDSIKSFQLKLNKEFNNINIKIDESSIMGNQDGIKQIFNNILQNIVAYNIGDELSINAKLFKEDYIITFSHLGEEIFEQQKDLIFERFYRIEESRSTKTDGAGLGLSIAKGIVDSHGGDIGVNTDGNNHTFWIKFPLDKSNSMNK